MSNSNSGHEDAVEILRQAKERAESLHCGDGPWTVVCDDWHDGTRSGGRFVAFSNPNYRERALQSAAWDLTRGDGGPGFSQSGRGGEWVTTYERNTAGPDLEPLVIIQDHAGVVPTSFLISEEFRLLMGLWEERATGNFYAISTDGSKELAIRISGERIEIRTPLLRRYQAARQLDLLLFTDSAVYVDSAERADAFGELEETDHLEGENAVLFLGVGDGLFEGRRVFSRLLVKRVLPSPPQEDCGIWPWEQKDDNYPEFIIGEDSSGREIRHTCDPEQLANYFGKNPNAPHYLTPVFFRPEVLRRYYDDPETYSVTDGRLSCAALWGVQIDNGNPETVMVFLGDLGRDLPGSHRDHWRSYNVPPVGRMSESTYRRSFLAQAAESENPEHGFKSAYQELRDTWLRNWGWDLYREPDASDAQLLQRTRIPLNGTDTEFEGQLLNLAKTLVDLLNESALVANLAPVKDEKGISKFERFLRSASYPYVERDIGLLRRIQTLRSKIAAHTSGTSGRAFLAQELDGLSKPDFVTKFMRDATQMLVDLALLAPPADADRT